MRNSTDEIQSITSVVQNAVIMPMILVSVCILCSPADKKKNRERVPPSSDLPLSVVVQQKGRGKTRSLRKYVHERNDANSGISSAVVCVCHFQFPVPLNHVRGYHNDSVGR